MMAKIQLAFILSLLILVFIINVESSPTKKSLEKESANKEDENSKMPQSWRRMNEGKGRIGKNRRKITFLEQVQQQV
jgi:hypothetical protein